MTDEIKQILESHSETLQSHSEMLKSQGEVLNSHSEMLKSHGEQLDLIAMKVVNQEGEIGWVKENMATHADINSINNTLDRIVKLVEKKDQELTVVTHDMKNFDDRLETVEKDVRKMKPALGLA